MGHTEKVYLGSKDGEGYNLRILNPLETSGPT